MKRPRVVDGVRYNPLHQAGCEGCAAWESLELSGRPTPLCKKIRRGDLAGSCLGPSVIWLTDVEFAARRLTEGVTDEL